MMNMYSTTERPKKKFPLITFSACLFLIAPSSKLHVNFKVLGTNDIQISDAILVKNLDLKVGEVDNETELDLSDAFFKNIVSLFHRHIGPVVTVHDGHAENTAVSVSGEWGFDHCCQIVHPIKLRAGSLAVTSQ